MPNSHLTKLGSTWFIADLQLHIHKKYLVVHAPRHNTPNSKPLEMPTTEDAYNRRCLQQGIIICYTTFFERCRVIYLIFISQKDRPLCVTEVVGCGLPILVSLQDKLRA